MHYLALLFGQEGGPEPEPGSPEFDAELEKYAAFEAAAGKAIAGGAALYPSDTAVNITHSGGNPIVTDGPFTEQAEVVGGFTVFETENLDDCLQLVQKIPAAADGYVEVWPMAEYMQAEGAQSDWWLALLLEPPGDIVAPGTPEWDAGAAEHVRFGEKVGDVIRGGGSLHLPDSVTTVRVHDGQVLLTDGPFTESAEVANGLYMFAAPDREAATAIAVQIPLGDKGRVELRQIVDLGE
ncbi:YciI family protein [Antrihabitans sp. YC2-6]|uniref:YciI family protein n=1 Tax=Antrihabitans sp. YC2-6 TaxID=2799498 RepID=UPI0018F71442|nr:YciI family protein [Antrihabitans sp. YC2-6]MBJ8344347.1 transcription initiation protein [Antrihabitans sp. YC2-6]